jgi:hypothetical protein
VKTAGSLVAVSALMICQPGGASKRTVEAVLRKPSTDRKRLKPEK